MPFLNQLASDNESSLVSAFYDRHPYPDETLKDEPPQGFNWRWSFNDVYSFCTGALPFKYSSSGIKKILDAGCGSGVSTDYLAYLNPGSQILAVDISNVALKVAIERLRRSGGDKQVSLRFENRSLFDLKGEGPFDYINSVGVLHHLQDPLSGLNELGSLLKEGGILHLFLYAEGGRSEITHVRKALKTLGVLDTEFGLQLARDLIRNLPPNNSLRRNYEERWAFECTSDVNFADMYLHPREMTFNLHRLWELIDNSDLEFIGFSNPNVWSLERFLNGELLKRAKILPKLQQLHLVENLDQDISHFEFFLSKGELPKYEWKNDNDLLATTGVVSRRILGWPSTTTFYDSEMNRLEINDDCLQLLKAIKNHPGKPMNFLPLNWDKSLTASIARDLQKRQLLLLYPI
ncbi:class I SAM-dependent methyltransferase [Prochlorococcus sp. MIT 1307]|uniref:class I SAM-dependent methyltransferase n=1 Tax=Prochlorococcus sp. MIT 1307 TaxID=3096219 RepID=UPI002A749EFE|nr:class I SAM-dependent methyltransferase [Prochlorococcus sp. MIT 1307]